MKEFVKRLFGSRSEPKPVPPPAAPAVVKPAALPAVAAATAIESGAVPVPSSGQAADLVAFVEYVVRSLVNQTNDVKVTSEVDAQGLLIRIHCHQEEVGRIIGKSGKTIRAIRSLVKGAAARQNQKASVIVMEG